MKLKKPITRADRLFRAFSDRTRLRILSLLRHADNGEMCVCDIVAVVDAPQPKISRHLAYLRKSGLVKARRDGLWMHYSLCQPSGEFHSKLLECLACCFSDVPELKGDAKKFKHRTGGCCP